MRTRRARPEDAEAIALLIEHYAGKGLLLARSRDEIRSGIDRFLAATDGRRIVGCVALESYGPDLAEIRSIAVDPGAQRSGLGAQLLCAAIAEAQRRGYARVFAMTYAGGFFVRHGFQPVERRALPEKIERDCARCPHVAGCRLMAVKATVVQRDMRRPVLASEAAAPIAS